MDLFELRRHWPFFVALCVVSFGLNWPWEMMQMPAYVEMAGHSWRETVLPCAWASLGDVALTLIVYAVIALAAGRFDWPLEIRWHSYAAAALLAAICAAAFEWKSLVDGRWSYSSRMPLVPVLGVGLWPLLQLSLLVPAALGLAAWGTCFQGRQRTCSSG